MSGTHTDGFYDLRGTWTEVVCVITLYTGSVGSGKSYHAVEVALEWLAKGKYVLANFPITPPKRYFGHWHRRHWERKLSRFRFVMDFTPEYLIAYSLEKGFYGRESSCLVVIDEAGILFNSRDWQVMGEQRKNWIKFLSQSRKFGYDFILVAQSDRMIDRQIRGLIEYEVKHLKANNSFFLSWLGLFRVTCFLYVYRWYHTKIRGNLRMAVYKSWIANRYDTMRVFNLDELINGVESIYVGKVIPAPVAAQIAAWRAELDARNRAEVEGAEPEAAAEAEPEAREGGTA